MDLSFLNKFGIAPERRGALILSEGGDAKRSRLPEKPQPDPPIVLMAARLLWDKGMVDLAKAAKSIDLIFEGQVCRYRIVKKF